MSDQQTTRTQGVGDEAIRASDGERAAIVEQLKRAHDEGRLTLDEFADRIARARQARTRGELQELVADLPASSAPPGGSQASPHGGGARLADTHLLPIGGWKQRGRIRLDRDINVFSLIGGINLDLTDAEFASNDVTITSTSLLGGADVTVPGNVRVEIEGLSLLGGRDIKIQQPTDPAAPVLRLRIFRLIGGVEVRNG